MKCQWWTRIPANHTVEVQKQRNNQIWCLFQQHSNQQIHLGRGARGPVSYSWPKAAILWPCKEWRCTLTDFKNFCFRGGYEYIGPLEEVFRFSSYILYKILAWIKPTLANSESRKKSTQISIEIYNRKDFRNHLMKKQPCFL